MRHEPIKNTHSKPINLLSRPLGVVGVRVGASESIASTHLPTNASPRPLPPVHAKRKVLPDEKNEMVMSSVLSPFSDAASTDATLVL